MNNEKLGATPQMYVGGDAKQPIEFAWHKTIACNIPKVGQPWITNLN